MADSSSFTSLFSLVDSHLSQTNLNGDPQPSTSGLGAFKLPPLNINRGSSDTRLFSPFLRLPELSTSNSQFPVNDVLSSQLGSMINKEPQSGEQQGSEVTSLKDCPINDVLARQLSNMFKAREAKEEERKRNMPQKKEEAPYMIDLVSVVKNANKLELMGAKLPSNNSSMESLIMPDTEEIVELKEPIDLAVPGPSRSVSPTKPIGRDMRYILKHRIGRSSQFGKVLCARYRPLSVPYFRINCIPHRKIKMFDFSTPSPDDIAKNRLRAPYYNNINKLSVYD